MMPLSHRFFSAIKYFVSPTRSGANTFVKAQFLNVGNRVFSSQGLKPGRGSRFETRQVCSLRGSDIYFSTPDGLSTVLS
jgi:hypothetical protein